MRAIILFAIMLFFSLAPVAQGQEKQHFLLDSWKIGKISGAARIEVPGHEAMVITKGRVLFPGQTLMTGHRTRLQMTNGKQRLQLGSNTVLSLPSLHQQKADMTIIRQLTGTVTFSIDKKNKKHFKVETPYMVAAVKGTEFTVSIDPAWANVRVHKGIVEVRNSLNDEAFDVTAGQAAAMNVVGLHGKGWFASRSASPERAASLTPALLSRSSPALASARLTLVARGEESPEKRAMLREQTEREGSSNILGLIGGAGASLLAAVFGFFGAIANAIYGWISSLIVAVLSPLLDRAEGFAALDHWVRVVMIGLAAGLLLGAGSLYYFLFHRR
nr:FecR domain-containing protein [uncultured Cohaesibacter sp.]